VCNRVSANRSNAASFSTRRRSFRISCRSSGSVSQRPQDRPRPTAPRRPNHAPSSAGHREPWRWRGPRCVGREPGGDDRNAAGDGASACGRSSAVRSRRSTSNRRGHCKFAGRQIRRSTATTTTRAESAECPCRQLAAVQRPSGCRASGARRQGVAGARGPTTGPWRGHVVHGQFREHVTELQHGSGRTDGGPFDCGFQLPHTLPASDGPGDAPSPRD
jgi:hypothetical protein